MNANRILVDFLHKNGANTFANKLCVGETKLAFFAYNNVEFRVPLKKSVNLLYKLLLLAFSSKLKYSDNRQLPL